MKKKIAVFANGWGDQYLREVATGISDVAVSAGFDVFVFINFSIMSDEKNNNNGEMNIFRLPDLADFDGAIILANSFNVKTEVDYVHDCVIKTGIPAISVEYEYGDIPAVMTDNYSGMFDLVNHLVNVHNANNIVFIGGPSDHPESNERLKACQDVLSKHGYSLPADNIYHGDWAMNLAKTLIDDWINKHEGLIPDAVVCANDVMAMGVIDQLKERGYRIPEDVIVTGYDCIELAQAYDPPVASVSHEWYDMGIKAINELFNVINGGTAQEIDCLKTRFVCGGSCGCEHDRKTTREQIQIGKADSLRHFKFEGIIYDSHFRHIYLAVRKVSNLADLEKGFNKLFTEECWLEGSNFMLCLEPDIANVDEIEDINPREGFSDNIDVICNLIDGQAFPRKTMSCKDAMFAISNRKTEPDVYIFVPLSSEGRAYGFSIMNRSIDIVLENYLCSWTRHMNQYLEQFRQNIIVAELTRKLTELSVTDMLTGVYNRAGCEQIAYPMIEECCREGKNGVVLIVDIDRMKTINDVHGHSSGDLALKTVAFVLQSVVPTEWIISRFGGDEFFIGGQLEDDIDLDEMIDSISEKLESEKIRRKIDFDLTVSVGYSVVKPDSNINVEKNLIEADKIMYIIKKSHHEEADRK